MFDRHFSKYYPTFDDFNSCFQKALETLSALTGSAQGRGELVM
jgi:hypothetical protein